MTPCGMLAHHIARASRHSGAGSCERERGAVTAMTGSTAKVVDPGDRKSKDKQQPEPDGEVVLTWSHEGEVVGCKLGRRLGMETKLKSSRIVTFFALAMLLTSCTKFSSRFVLPDLCKLFEDIPTIELSPSRPPAPPIQGSCSKMLGR
jgi:hypothetical protein